MHSVVNAVQAYKDSWWRYFTHQTICDIKQMAYIALPCKL